MLLYLDSMHWLILLVWVGLLFLYLGLLAGVLLTSRTLRVALRLAWTARSTPPRRGQRALLIGVGCAILAIFLLQVSAGESVSVRIAVALIGGAVAWLFLDWAARHTHSSLLRRSAEERDWLLRAISAREPLLGIFDRTVVLERACSLLRDNLDCASVYAFTLQDGEFRFAAAAPAAPKAPPVFALRSLLAAELSSGYRFRALPIVHPHGFQPLRWSSGPEEAWEAENMLLDSLRAHCAVPMQSGVALDGFFLLGAPIAGVVYSPSQLAFAEEVARHAAHALRACDSAAPALAQAAEQALEQASRRNARATRTHLAPPDRFQLPDLDFASDYWLGDVPGGAFYDILALPGRSAAFFLAEIPGPAEEASVRLVQLQALLRTRARAYHQDLAELAESTRRAIQLSAAGRPPISLFCARFVSGSSRLRYLNAGVYPPIHLRCTTEGAQIVRLTAGGDPLDAQSDSHFTEGEIEFLPGDILAVGSSGIASASSPDGAAWGEGGLVDALLTGEQDRAAEIARHALDASARFTGNSKSQPPRVLLVLRRRESD